MSMFDDVAPSFINRSKATSVRLQGGGIYIGIVTRIAGTSLDRIYVKVPKLGGVNEYGPCVVVGVIPSVGDFVLVGFLDNKMSEMVSFGTFSEHPPTYDLLWPILEQYAPKASPTFTGTVTLPSETYIGNVSATEIGYVDGVTSSIQTQLNSKAPKVGPEFTGTVILPSTTSIGTVSATEISYVDGVTSSIQTQIDTKAPTASPTFTGTATGTFSNRYIIGTASQPNFALANGDIGKLLECTLSGMNIWIYNDTITNLPVGCEYHFVRRTSGTVSIVPLSGVTLNGTTTTRTIRAQYSMITLIKRGASEWYLLGDFA